MTVKINITFKEILKAQDMGFADHRQFVASRFEALGYIVTNFLDLRFKTFQDGKPGDFKIYTTVEGDVGKALMRVPRAG